MQERLITQVSISGKEDKITIKYDQGGREKWERGEEEGSHAFYTSMQVFIDMFIESAGLDSEYWQSGAVTSIVLKHSEAGTAIALTGTASINNKYATVSSPSRIVEASDQKLLDNLVKQAIAYLEGDRSQQSLLT